MTNTFYCDIVGSSSNPGYAFTFTLRLMLLVKERTPAIGKKALPISYWDYFGIKRPTKVNSSINKENKTYTKYNVVWL